MTAIALRREWGLGAVQEVNVGDVWQLDFESDKPVSPQQFFALVSRFQLEASGNVKTISFSAIDQTHFRTILQFLKRGMYHGIGGSEVIDGIKFTVIDGKPYVETATEGLSKGAMVGIGIAGAGTLGTIIYLATRKKPRRRRRS